MSRSRVWMLSLVLGLIGCLEEAATSGGEDGSTTSADLASAPGDLVAPDGIVLGLDGGAGEVALLTSVICDPAIVDPKVVARFTILTEATYAEAACAGCAVDQCCGVLANCMPGTTCFEVISCFNTCDPNVEACNTKCAGPAQNQVAVALLATYLDCVQRRCTGLAGVPPSTLLHIKGQPALALDLSNPLSLVTVFEGVVMPAATCLKQLAQNPSFSQADPIFGGLAPYCAEMIGMAQAVHCRALCEQAFVEGTAEEAACAAACEPLLADFERKYYECVDACNNVGSCELACENQLSVHPTVCAMKPTATSCTPSCEPGQCGWDGCGGSCATCPTNQICNPFGRCLEACAPTCANRDCGRDGCFGDCGMCTGGKTCRQASSTCCLYGSAGFIEECGAGCPCEAEFDCYKWFDNPPECVADQSGDLIEVIRDPPPPTTPNHPVANTPSQPTNLGCHSVACAKVTASRGKQPVCDNGLDVEIDNGCAFPVRCYYAYYDGADWDEWYWVQVGAGVMNFDDQGDWSCQGTGPYRAVCTDKLEYNEACRKLVSP